MATPHVSATAALVIASGVLGPHPTPAQITARLRATARKLGGGGDERLYGAGLLDAAAATAPGGPGAVAKGWTAVMPITTTMSSQASERADIAIVGGGILGLAVARELGKRNPGASICVLEREREIGTHQTGHNSGVIHAGVYYVPGSLKARLCVEGAREMYEYCEQRGIASERCGKVIVATERLRARAPRTSSSGAARPTACPGLRRIDADGIAEIEPHARGIAGLHSPGDGHRRLPRGRARLRARTSPDAGGTIATGCEVRGRLAARARAAADALPRRAPRRATRSSAPAPGRTAWPSPPAPTRTRASSPSAAPTCACCPSAATSCAR